MFGLQWGTSSGFLDNQPWSNNGGNTAQVTLCGAYTTCRILKARLLVAPISVRFGNLKADCQTLVAQIAGLGQRPDAAGGCSGRGLIGSLFMS